MNVVDRFLQYVKFDTQSDELTNLTPSTPGQMIFAQHLEKELRELGLSDISLDENGYLMATLPANTDKADIPTVGFIAHLDTSPDMSGRHVSPRIVQNYDGSDITFFCIIEKVMSFLRDDIFSKIIRIHYFNNKYEAKKSLDIYSEL